jgi:hypothetical protein
MSHTYRSRLNADQRRELLELKTAIVSIVGCKENLKELRAVYALLTPGARPTIASPPPKLVPPSQPKQASTQRSLRGIRL